MDETEVDYDNFASETVSLLILNELRLMRRDIKAGLLRLEEKIDKILSNKSNLELSLAEIAADIKTKSNSPTSLSQRRSRSIESNSICKIEETTPSNDPTNETEKNLVACTVHVDLSELPVEDEVEDENYNGEDNHDNSEEHENSNKIAIRKTNHFVASIVENQEGRYQCKICENSYSNKGNLRRHYRQHTGDMRYQCSVCNKKFYRNEYLVRHMNKHKRTTKYGSLNERPFKCGTCQKEFRGAISLREHMRIHRIDKTLLFSCSLCTQKFSREDIYKQHIRKVHSEENRW